MFHNKIMEENIIINLQSFSNKFLDIFFNAQSYIASWIGAIFLFLVIIIFINKRFGLNFGIGFLLSIGINYLIKIIVNRQRPYEANANIINKLQTIGKSFPSGHMVSCTFMVLVIWYLFIWLNKNGKFNLYNKLWFKILIYVFGIIFIILTAIARMYLGQHYITDILAGILVAIIGFFVSKIVFKKQSQ